MLGLGRGYMVSKFSKSCLPPLPSPHHPGQAWALPLPVVVSIVPVVKVHQEAAVHHVGHAGHTDEGRVHTVHGLQLHAHLEAQGWGTLGARRGAATARPGRLVPAWRPLAREGVGSLRVMLGLGGGINRQNHNPQPRATQELAAPKEHSEDTS